MANSPFGGDIKKSLDNLIQYSPGKADTPFAKKFGHLAGKEVKTVGDAFTSFTDVLGTPINALYKSVSSDLVGTLHLVVVNARFEKDPVFSLGIVTVINLIFKNYPEQNIAERVKTALLESAGLDEAEVDAEAAELLAWAQGKSKEDIATALRGEGDSKLAETAIAIKGNEWWMYSRFFGLGMVKLMEVVGVEQDMSFAYDVMEDWVGNCLGKPHYTACNDSDDYFKQKGKLDMMETMMKEIEIREKKRMADRLEAKAEIAMIAVEKAAKFKIEEEKEAAAKAAKDESDEATS